MIPILLLTHNGLALTKEAVRSVRKQDVATHLVVVDNNSTDGTREWLRTLPPDYVTVMALGENAGVSKAWNRGLRWLFDRERVPAVLVINNDVQLRTETARTLADDGRLFVTAVGVNSLAESQQPWARADRPNPDYSAFLIRREAWMRVGEFDERFFAWHGDNDYHVRLTRAGVWAGTCGIPFYHVAAATVKSSERDKDQRARWRELFERDRRAFAAKWGMLPGTKEYERATTLPLATAGAVGAGTPDSSPLLPSASESPSASPLAPAAPSPGR